MTAIRNAIEFLMFWIPLLFGRITPARYFDADDQNDLPVYGMINIEYLGKVEPAKGVPSANKYILTFQRKPESKWFGRYLFSFNEKQFADDMNMALKTIRRDIYVYYTKLGRS